MSLGTIANFATTFAVLVAIAFGMLEIRKAREERHERAAFAVIRTVMSPTWIRSLNSVLLMPESTGAADIQVV